MDEALRKEKEFYKRNSELEQRTRYLLREAQELATIPEAIPNSKGWILAEKYQTGQSSGDSNKAGSSKETVALNGGGCSSCSSCSGTATGAGAGAGAGAGSTAGTSSLGLETANKVLRAKLDILNKEIDEYRSESLRRAEDSRRLRAELQRLEELRARSQHQLTVAKNASAVLDEDLHETQEHLKERERDIVQLNKEIAALRKENKSQQQQISSTDVRLSRALEEAERLRGTVKGTQQQIKEARDSFRQTNEQQQNTIRKLERQRTELSAIVNKQTLLIDNLRRQKSHYEMTQMVNIASNEFDKLLDWCLEQEKTLVN